MQPGHPLVRQSDHRLRLLRRTGANAVNVMKRVKEELAYVNAIDADKEIQLE
jgi:hypothetical protein